MVQIIPIKTLFYKNDLLDIVIEINGSKHCYEAYNRSIERLHEDWKKNIPTEELNSSFSLFLGSMTYKLHHQSI